MKSDSSMGDTLWSLDGQYVAERGCRIYVLGAHATPSGYWLQVAFDDAPGQDLVLHMLEGATSTDAMKAIVAAVAGERWPHVIDVHARRFSDSAEPSYHDGQR
jgi:hypothetical protein